VAKVAGILVAMDMIDSAVVAVAGLGTRLYPTSAAVPKEMLPLGRYPVLHHVLEELTAAGIRRILLVTNSRKPAIKKYVDGLPALAQTWKRIDFEFVEQGIPTSTAKPAGTGDAVALAERFVGDRHFVVAFGDSIVDGDCRGSLVRRMIRQHEARQAACCIAVTEVPQEDVSRYGVVEPKQGAGDDGTGAIPIDGIVEKPTPENAPSNLAVSARYSFSPAIFRELKETKSTPDGEVYLTHAIAGLINSGLPVFAVPLNGQERRCDIGNHASYFEAFVDFALADPDCGDCLASYMQNALVHRTT
jgi:UTP--glucose-1-phosphate uridylyltransferase